MKKAIAILCLIAIVLTLPVYANAEKYADELNALGLFKGTEKGYELDKKLTRAEAVTMIIRLMGKEADALANVRKHPFGDVPKWADSYIGFAYVNKISYGESDTNFNPNGEVSDYQFLTMVLRICGYKDGEDFTWDKPYELAEKAGLLDNVDLSGGFKRGEAVIICWNYLQLNKTPQSIKTTNVYESASITPPEGYTYVSGSATVHNGRLYYLCGDNIENNEEVTPSRYFYSCDIDGKNGTIVKLYSSGGYNTISMLSNNKDFILSMGRVMRKMIKDNNYNSYNVELMDAYKMLNPQIEQYNEMMINFYISSGLVKKLNVIDELVTDADDNMYVAADDTVYVISKDYKLLFQIAVDIEYEIFRSTDDVIYVRDTAEKTQYYRIDNDKQALVKMDFDFGENYYRLLKGAGNNKYYSTKTGIYKYNGSKSELLLDWFNSDLDAEGTRIVYIVSDDKLIAEYEGGLALLTRMPDDKIVEKTVIKISDAAKVSLIDSALKFNRSSDTYRVVFDSSAPDVIVVDGEANGNYVDLYSFMEKDKEISKDDILYSVRTANETSGKLYAIPESFYLDTVIRRNSDGKQYTIKIDTTYMLAFMKYLSESHAVSGYPVKSGNSTLVGGGDKLAISSGSAVKDGAWSFIKFRLMNTPEGGLPVVEAAFDKAMEGMRDIYYHIYNDNADVYSIYEYRLYHLAMSVAKAGVKMYRINEDDAAKLKKYLTSTATVNKGGRSDYSVTTEEICFEFNLTDERSD